MENEQFWLLLNNLVEKTIKVQSLCPADCPCFKLLAQAQQLIYRFIEACLCEKEDKSFSKDEIRKRISEARKDEPETDKDENINILLEAFEPQDIDCPKCQHIFKQLKVKKCTGAEKYALINKMCAHCKIKLTSKFYKKSIEKEASEHYGTLMHQVKDWTCKAAKLGYAEDFTCHGVRAPGARPGYPGQPREDFDEDRGGAPGAKRDYLGQRTDDFFDDGRKAPGAKPGFPSKPREDYKDRDRAPGPQSGHPGQGPEGKDQAAKGKPGRAKDDYDKDKSKGPKSKSGQAKESYDEGKGQAAKGKPGQAKEGYDEVKGQAAKGKPGQTKEDHAEDKGKSPKVKPGQAKEGYDDVKAQAPKGKPGQAKEDYAEDKGKSSKVKPGQAKGGYDEAKDQASKGKPGQTKEDHAGDKGKSPKVKPGQAKEGYDEVKGQAAKGKPGQTKEDHAEDKGKSPKVKPGQAKEDYDDVKAQGPKGKPGQAKENDGGKQKNKTEKVADKTGPGQIKPGKGNQDDGSKQVQGQKTKSDKVSKQERQDGTKAKGDGDQKAGPDEKKKQQDKSKVTKDATVSKDKEALAGKTTDFTICPQLRAKQEENKTEQEGFSEEQKEVIQRFMKMIEDWKLKQDRENKTPEAELAVLENFELLKRRIIEKGDVTGIQSPVTKVIGIKQAQSMLPFSSGSDAICTDKPKTSVPTVIYKGQLAIKNSDLEKEIERNQNQYLPYRVPYESCDISNFILEANKVSGQAAAKEPDKKTVEPDKGVLTSNAVRYALSDPKFIDIGWTKLPSMKLVRKVNVYRTTLAKPEFDWFSHNKNKGTMFYATGERLADFVDDRGYWFYKNGKIALECHKSEEPNAEMRYTVYSNKSDKCPDTVLASFDQLGNGIIYDNAGNLRLKYNQFEGKLLDRSIGPETHWKWNSLNEPPDVQHVLVDTKLQYKDPRILGLNRDSRDFIPKDDSDMVAIETENQIKQMTRATTQDFRKYGVRMKTIKINNNFSLRMIDQSTIYLNFNEDNRRLKLHLGVVINHKEIVGTGTTEEEEMTNFEKLPAITESVAAIQRNIKNASNQRDQLNEKMAWKRPRGSGEDEDRMLAALSRPLRLPLIEEPKVDIEQLKQCYYQQSLKNNVGCKS